MLMIQLTLSSALNPTTDEAYEKVTKSLGKKLDTVTLEDGTRGHWIGDRSTEHILVFSHGMGDDTHITDGSGLIQTAS